MLVRTAAARISRSAASTACFHQSLLGCIAPAISPMLFSPEPEAKSTRSSVFLRRELKRGPRLQNLLWRRASSSVVSTHLHRENSPLLLALLSDMHHQEIASQALKCMGFMLYHPSLVSSISGFVGSALDSLERLIMKTKLKAMLILVGRLNELLE